MRSPKKALFTTLILLATLLQLPLAMGVVGWLGDWGYRVKLTIDSGDVDEVLSDFPILIYISDSSGINGENISFIFDEVGANSLKIAVTLSDGLTECYVEVEKWDLGNRGAWLWAKIASISNITDTDLYLYYDNDHADNTDKVGATNSVPAESVWDENFIIVWHMRDDPDTSHVRDSTGNDIDGTKKGANEPLLITAGKIDSAQDFTGGLGDDFISNTGLGNFANGFTFEIWFKTSYTSDRQTLTIQRGNADTNTEQFWARVDPGNNRIMCLYEDGTGNQDQVTAADYVDGAFHRLFWAVKNNRNNIWVDAVEEIDVATDTYAGINLDVHGYIGKLRSVAVEGYDFFDGPLDEVRISNTDRSKAWGQVSYQSEIDDLLDFGGEEEIPFTEAPTELFGAGFNGSTPVVDLYWKTNLTGITLFEVQNSTDKVSWEYLGQNTTAEYHDFQVVNGTERYYRVRACNYTDPVWDNSSWSDINFENVFFISEEAPALAMGKFYALAIILLILGLLIGIGVRRRR